MKIELEKYVDYLNGNEPNIDFDIIQTLKQKAKEDASFEQLMNTLPKITPDERKKLIDTWLFNQIIENTKNEEEVIASTLGLDVSMINHYKLKNEKDVFLFYHPELQTTIVLENQKDKNLAEQLKQYQNDYQLDKTDGINMLQEQRVKNGELGFVLIDKVNNYPHIIQKLKPEEKQALDYLLKNKDRLKIKTVNIENALGITDEGKIVEAYFDKKMAEFRVEQPEESVYENKNDVKIEQQTDEKTSLENSNLLENEKIEQNMNLDNDLEDDFLVTQLKAEGLAQDKIEFILDKLELYNQYPELMEYLEEQDRIFYQKYLVIYRKNKERQKETSFQKAYKKDEKKAGFADVLILSLITSFMGGVFLTVILFLCQ